MARESPNESRRGSQPDSKPEAADSAEIKRREDQARALDLVGALHSMVRLEQRKDAGAYDAHDGKDNRDASRLEAAKSGQAELNAAETSVINNALKQVTESIKAHREYDNQINSYIKATEARIKELSAKKPEDQTEAEKVELRAQTDYLPMAKKYRDDNLASTDIYSGIENLLSHPKRKDAPSEIDFGSKPLPRPLEGRKATPTEIDFGPAPAARQTEQRGQGTPPSLSELAKDVPPPESDDWKKDLDLGRELPPATARSRTRIEKPDSYGELPAPWAREETRLPDDMPGTITLRGRSESPEPVEIRNERDTLDRLDREMKMLKNQLAILEIKNLPPEAVDHSERFVSDSLEAARKLIAELQKNQSPLAKRYNDHYSELANRYWKVLLERDSTPKIENKKPPVETPPSNKTIEVSNDQIITDLDSLLEDENTESPKGEIDYHKGKVGDLVRGTLQSEPSDRNLVSDLDNSLTSQVPAREHGRGDGFLDRADILAQDLRRKNQNNYRRGEADPGSNASESPMSISNHELDAEPTSQKRPDREYGRGDGFLDRADILAQDLRRKDENNYHQGEVDPGSATEKVTKDTILSGISDDSELRLADKAEALSNNYAEVQKFLKGLPSWFRKGLGKIFRNSTPPDRVYGRDDRNITVGRKGLLEAAKHGYRVEDSQTYKNAA